jgi:hypothetical protein
MTHTLERRKLEVFFAMVTAGFGLWLLFPSQAMVSPALGGLLRMTPEAAWGGMFLTNGLMHCAWLAVNGARWWSPIVRFGAAFNSFSLYLIWSASIRQYDPASTGVFTYASLSAGALACCVFAWRDALTSVRVRRGIVDA